MTSEIGGVGRNPIGPAFTVRFPLLMIAEMDHAAAVAGITRAAWLRLAAERMLAGDNAPPAHTACECAELPRHGVGRGHAHGNRICAGRYEPGAPTLGGLRLCGDCYLGEYE